jgi:hypothetical protein
MHPLVMVPDCDGGIRKPFVPPGNQTPGLLRFVFSSQGVRLPGVEAHCVHVEDVTDEDDTLRLPLLSEMLAKRQVPGMARRLVNVTDDEYAGHGVNISILISSVESHPNVPPSSNSAVVNVIATPDESRQNQRESPAPVGFPSTA